MDRPSSIPSPSLRREQGPTPSVVPAVNHLRGSPSQRAPRSCQLCNRRKVRCDKKEPCGPCSKANKTCVFPPPGPRLRRTKQAMTTEMASRITYLEKTLDRVRRTERSEWSRSPRLRAATPSGPPSISESAPDATALSSETSVDVGTHQRTSAPMYGRDVLVQTGSASQYFNDVVMSRVINEEQHVQTALTTPQNTSTPSQSPSPFSALGILSTPDMSAPPHSLHPPSKVAISLWNRYIDFVETCPGPKLLHVPTDEVKVFGTIQNPVRASLEDLALCFAIYFSACVTMDHSEVEAIMAQERTKTLLGLKTGFEQALAHAGFLDTPTLTELQAVSIYLSAIRVRNRGKGLWMLNGLLIRASRSLGLHMNGEQLGLSPFQSEVRRRLWWHLITRDGRANEDYGIQLASDHLQPANVAMPLNVEDVDLHPDMEELPQSRKQWTPITHTLIHMEVALAMQKLTSIGMSSSSPSEEAREQVVNQTKEKVEGYLTSCNPILPRQRLALLVARFVLRKLDFVSRVQWKLLQSPASSDQFASEKNLHEAIGLLEQCRAMETDEMLQPYLVPTKAYPQYSLAMYILWHLCARPLGPDSERAWELVNSFLESESEFEFQGIGTKVTVLDALSRKAKSMWERVQNADSAAFTEDNGRHTGHSEVPLGQGIDTAGVPLMFPFASDRSGSDFDVEPIQYLDWMAFVPRFQVMEGVGNVSPWDQ